MFDDSRSPYDGPGRSVPLYRPQIADFAEGVEGVVTIPAAMWEARERIYWAFYYGILIHRDDIDTLSPTPKIESGVGGQSSQPIIENPVEAFTSTLPEGYTSVKFEIEEDDEAGA